MNEANQLRRDVAADLHNVQAATMQREQQLIFAIQHLARAIERLGNQMDGGLPNDVRSSLHSAIGAAQSAGAGPTV